MKTKILLGSLLFTMGLCASCDELTPEAVEFDVVANNTTVKVGEPVEFNFVGNPNFITLYSGEEGHMYKNRNRVEIAAEDIESTSLSFTVNAKYGMQENALRVYLANEFPGLSMDRLADSTLVADHSWNDITEACKIADAGVTVVSDFDLSDYQGGLVLAFQYFGTTESSPQKTIIIDNLTIQNTLKNGKVTKINGNDLNFNVFDVVPSNTEADPYLKVVSGATIKGTWSLANLVSNNKIVMQGGKSGIPTWANNDDWLITNNIKLNSCSPDRGQVIKDISRRVPNYTHKFQRPGVYTVTFLAGNASVKGEKKIIKQIKITVEQNQEVVS